MVESYRFSECARGEAVEFASPREWLGARYVKGSIFGLDNLMSSGRYKLLGWSYDFRPYMKKLLVRQYGSWQEYWAPNKTALRRVLYGKIEKIMEVK